jgi:hypothetical protein
MKRNASDWFRLICNGSDLLLPLLVILLFICSSLRRFQERQANPAPQAVLTTPSPCPANPLP